MVALKPTITAQVGTLSIPKQERRGGIETSVETSVESSLQQSRNAVVALKRANCLDRSMATAQSRNAVVALKLACEDLDEPVSDLSRNAVVALKPQTSRPP